MTDAGADAIARALEKNTTLRALDLSCEFVVLCCVVLCCVVLCCVVLCLWGWGLIVVYVVVGCCWFVVGV